MASLSLSGFTEYFSWTISGLGNFFNTSYYTSAGIATSKATSGSYTAPRGIVDSINAPSSSTSKSCGSGLDYSPGTYTFYGWVTDTYGRYYPCGSDTVTVKSSVTGGNVTLNLSTGIASARIAYVDYDGTRHPSSGYTTSYGGTYEDLSHLYVDTVTFEDGYTTPWLATFGGSYTQATNNDRTSGYGDVAINVYPINGKSASLTLRGTYTTGNVRVNFGSGVSSLQIAYRDSSGNRHPSTDGTYTTYTSAQLFTNVHMVYVGYISLSSSYQLPWNASYSGYYTSETTTSRTSGTTTTVNAIIYPESGSTANFTISGTQITYNYYIYWFDLYESTATPYRTSTKEGTTQETYDFIAPTMSKTGYDFEGWCASYSGKNGTGSIVVGGGETITLPYLNQRSITLYARWSIHTYNISFNANGGSGTMNSITNCTYGTAYTLPKNQFTRNYTITLDYNYDNKKVTKNAKCPFLYWSYNNNTYADQATVKNLADSGTATLYAQWGNYSVELPTLIRSGYVFLGWFTSATGGSQVSSPATGMSDRTLYAHWKEDVISPTISNVSHTDTTITISLNRNNATTGSWIIEASLSNFGTVVYTATITSTTQTTITLTGLTPETTYYIRARHVNGGVSANSNVISATTRTSTFQWTSDDSVYVIKSAVFTDAITAAKWNELIEKVNWCRRRKGLSTVLLNDAIRGQPILATNFTAMRNAIADMHTVTPARSAGDEILATYFANSDTSLKSAINAVITTL